MASQTEPVKRAGGREKELTLKQREVMRELRNDKKQTIEELAVGFGVSYNTVRNVLAETGPLVPVETDGTVS